jgi:hypothetical protein
MNNTDALTQIIGDGLQRGVFPRKHYPAVLHALRLLEAASYRSQATAAINVAKQYIGDAALTLQNSKFSQSALQRFGGRVMNALKNTAQELLDLGWHAGKGKGDAPQSIVKEYLDTQLGFLATWITDIEAAGQLVGGVNRALMYAQSLEQVYQKAYLAAKGQAVGLPDLPAYPRDGSTRCHTNCNCAWSQIEQKSDTEFRVTWKLRPGENCEDCLQRANDWNPLRIVLQEDGTWQFIAKSGVLEV